MLRHFGHSPCTSGQQGLSAQVLEPLGFSRHFFRTEVRNDTGSLVFLDFQQPVNLTTWNRCVYHRHPEYLVVLTGVQPRRRQWMPHATWLTRFSWQPCHHGFSPYQRLAATRRTLHLSSEQLPQKRACSISDVQQPYWQWQEQPHGCAHRHYIQLPSPYYGWWRHSASHRV